MTNTWIITTSNQIASLVEAARAIGPVTVVALGDEAKGIAGVDRVIAIGRGSDAPLEAFSPAVVELLSSAGADIVFAANRPVERVVAGALAARLGLPLLNGATRVAAGEAELSRFGGISLETVSFPAGAVVLLEGGTPTEGEEVSAQDGPDSHYEASVSTGETVASGSTNLASAQRIVAAGRGFAAEEDLQLARDLAEALGADLACSRPLTEGDGWMPRDRYIGLSGQYVAPELYVAVGISGQVQHTCGMSDSAVVVAVNNDADAPIFQVADYGIVGDLYEVLPAITAALA